MEDLCILCQVGFLVVSNGSSDLMHYVVMSYVDCCDDGGGGQIIVRVELSTMSDRIVF